MEAETRAAIAQTAQHLTLAHGYWLTSALEAVHAQDARAVFIAEDIDEREIEATRLMYPGANMDRNRDDVLAELVAWGYLARCGLGYRPTPMAYALDTRATNLECARLNLALVRPTTEEADRVRS